MDYVLRDIDSEKWKTFKAITTLKGLSLKQQLHQMIDKEIKKNRNLLGGEKDKE